MTRLRLTLISACLLGASGWLSAQQAEENLRPRRIYFGAPPATPHKVAGAMTDCLECHAGSNPIAPKTPHPTMVNCRQCHPQAAESTPLFRATRFAGLKRPAGKSEEKPVSPPAMAHAILLHEDCLACHAPAAKKDIKVSPHPERQRCTGCHKPQNPEAK